MTNDFILCVSKGWDSYISCEFHEIHTELIKLGWKRLVIDEVNDMDILSAIHRAKVVLLWEAYEFIERNELVLMNEPDSSTTAKKFFFCDDPHFFSPYRRGQRLRAFNWAETILATYPDKLHEWFPEVPSSKIKWMPHSAASCFSPTFEPSSDLILLSGSRTWPYPFRQFCHIKLPVDVCDIVDHPGYPGYPGDVNNKSKHDQMQMKHVGREQYANLLRRYPAMLVCGSIFNYLVAKVFEGMSAGCLVICDRASLSHRLSMLGFVEGQHYIGTDIFHVVDDAVTVKNMYLHDRQRWRFIVDNAFKKVHAEHRTEHRAAQINHECTASIMRSFNLESTTLREII
jgi:hypothetical protein